MAPAAFAEGNGTAQHYDDSVITGFELPDSALTVDTAYKYAMIALQKEFPAQLTVYLGGVVSSRPGKDGVPVITGVEDYLPQSIDVTWKCLEDYDEDLDVFHFVPALEAYALADGLELPVITVNVLGRIEIPPLIQVPEEFHPALPSPSGPVSNGGRQTLTYYNGYEQGILPPVRNQNPYGTCWAFATIAALEADLIHDGKAGTDIDLSELHLAYYTYHNFYDAKGCNTGDTVYLNGEDYLNAGGAPFYASMTLANMLGPNLESAVPYSQAAGYAPSADDGRTGVMQVTGVYSYNGTDCRDDVKNAIIDHGAVTAVFCADSSYYSATYNSFYCPEFQYTNHVVTLVGWNDNFSASEFRAGTPEGNGAWLVRNSWGVDDYNYAGYFWISYYDQSLAPEFYAFDSQTWRYDHCYAYDNSPLPWWLSYGEYVATISQDFTVDANEQIQAVGFFSFMSGCSVELSVSCGGKTASTSVYLSSPGYRVITLPEPLAVPNRSTATVSYYYTGGSGDLNYSFEGDGNYDNIVFSASAGSPFMVDGEYYEDEDEDGRRFDARLKLFTNDASVASPDLVLPSDLTTIGSEAFADGGFSSVDIPSGTTAIAPDAFGDRNDLTIFGVSGSYAETYADQMGFDFIPVA